jgi:hypothetical protein
MWESLSRDVDPTKDLEDAAPEDLEDAAPKDLEDQRGGGASG